MLLSFEQLVLRLLVCEQLGFRLGELVEFLVSRTHLLDHVLHLTGVLKLALHQFTFKALLDLRCQAQLVMHTFMFVEEAVHVGTLGLL